MKNGKKQKLLVHNHREYNYTKSMYFTIWLIYKHGYVLKMIVTRQDMGSMRAISLYMVIAIYMITIALPIKLATNFGRAMIID